MPYTCNAGHLGIINIDLVPTLVFEVLWLHGNTQFGLERDSLPVGMNATGDSKARGGLSQLHLMMQV